MQTIPKLTEEQALAAYEALVTGLARNYGHDPEELLGPQRAAATGELVVRRQGGLSWPDGPVLCADFEGWSTTSDWAVVWEGGPHDWTMYVPHGGRTEDFGLTVGPIDLPGVFCEPVNGFALALYPAEVA